MEKPTGVIQKIIESLQQVNALDVYSPIEKDIILHNLRAAYMIFLNIPIEEHSTEERVEALDFEELKVESEELKVENGEEEKEEEDEPIVEEEPLFEEEPLVAEEEPFVEEESLVEEENEKPLFSEAPLVEEKPLFSEAPLVAEEPVIPEKPLIDDILEFIPDAKPQSGLLFDDMVIPKSETKSLNDFLTEKKEDQSLGTKFQQSFIPDLTKAIAINEKFSFIRELFHNSGVDFSNAIQKLNDCDNLEAAFVLMAELKHQYLWDTTSTSYLSLCDLVRRRFL
jgi:hypothetical protein